MNDSEIVLYNYDAILGQPTLDAAASEGLRQWLERHQGEQQPFRDAYRAGFRMGMKTAAVLRAKAKDV
jgi:hypothetical protein